MRTIAKAAVVALLGAAATTAGTTPAAADPSCQLCVVVEDAVRSEYRASSTSPPIFDLGRMIFTISSGTAPNTPMTIPWEVDFVGSATAADLATSLLSGTATIPAGSSKTTVSVPIAQDTISEHNELFFLRIGDPSGNHYAEDPVGVGTILDDDPAKVSVIDADKVYEPSGPLEFGIRLSRPLTTSVTVWYSTQDGTAGSADYHPKSGAVVFAAGQTSKTITVNIKDDDIYHEPNEYLYLKITSVSGAPLADSSGTGVIGEDDIVG